MNGWSRWGGSVSIGLALAVALACCCAVARWRAAAAARPDAKLPFPGLDPKLLGPPLERAMESMSHNGPQWAGPPPEDCVE
jgi:hypothetical protein